jgi:predicted alpha-1,6-mannanase (GH76 family)
MKKPQKFAEGGTFWDEVVEVEAEVKQMTGSTILFEVEVEYYDDKEEKYYFKYGWDNDSHYLEAIYDSKMVELDKQSSDKLEKELEETMTDAVRDAISDYYDAKAEPDEYYEED